MSGVGRALFGGGPRRTNVNSAPWGDAWTQKAQQYTNPWMNPSTAGGYAQQFMRNAGFGVQSPSALQQQAGNTWSNYMRQPGPQMRTLNTMNNMMFGHNGLMGQVGDAYNQVGTNLADTRSALMPLLSGQQNLLDPLRSAYQGNVTDALARQSQFGGGPRFAQGAATNAAQLEQGMNRDWLNFAAPIMQQDVANRLSAGQLLGNLDLGYGGLGMQYGQFGLGAANTLGNLAQGASAERLNTLGGAGNFANALQGQQIQQHQFLNQATLDQLQKMQQFGLNQGTGPAVIEPGSQGMLGQIAGTALGMWAGGGFKNPFGGGTPTTSSPYPYGGYPGQPGQWATPGSGFGGWGPPGGTPTGWHTAPSMQPNLNWGVRR